MGEARPLQITNDEKYRLAVHECGHTAVAHFLPNADPLYKVTIIPRGQALGGTHQLPEKERYTMDEAYLKERLAVMLGGRVMEQEFLGTVSSGADGDIQQATKMARAMVARWGMDETLGPVDLRQDGGNPFVGLDMAQQREFSDQTAHEVDEAVKRILRNAEEHAREVVRKNRKAIEKLVDRLIEEETLGREEIETCLGTGAHGDDSSTDSASKSATRSKAANRGKTGRGGQKNGRGKSTSNKSRGKKEAAE